jgi:hypothetical protein
VVRLHGIVNTWGTRSDISKIAVTVAAREAAAAPHGTLLLVSAPESSWEWGAPFVLQPPFTDRDLSRQVRLVTPWRLDCCGSSQWGDRTSRVLNEWLRAPDHPPVIALHVAAETGGVSRLTDAEAPELRQLLAVVATIDSWQAINDSIVKLLEQRVRR